MHQEPDGLFSTIKQNVINKSVAKAKKIKMRNKFGWTNQRHKRKKSRQQKNTNQRQRQKVLNIHGGV
jgi:hypothetical protein